MDSITLDKAIDELAVGAQIDSSEWIGTLHDLSNIFAHRLAVSPAICDETTFGQVRDDNGEPHIVPITDRFGTPLCNGLVALRLRELAAVA